MAANTDRDGNDPFLRPAAGRGGVPTFAGHWSDAVFVRLRRLMGLRMELLVLMIAEVVARRYYGALPPEALWRLLLLAVCVVVAADHGAGLRRLGTGCLRFVRDVMASSHGVVSAVLVPGPGPAGDSAAPFDMTALGPERTLGGSRGRS